MTQITFYLFATKLGIKIKNNIEGHGQRSPKLIEMLSMLRYIFGPNLELPTSIVGEWLHGKAQKRVNFDFQVKFELEGQGQSTPKTIGILTKMFCMSGSNLVILVRTSDKLSHGQARDWRPHGQTQATTIPEGQNWPRVKNVNQFIKNKCSKDRRLHFLYQSFTYNEYCKDGLHLNLHGKALYAQNVKSMVRNIMCHTR